MRERFGDWHAPVRALIEATPAAAVLRHDIYDLAAYPASFVKGRTVLIGDAAHGMIPNLGQGAGQAIEDAATLSLLLRDGGHGADLQGTLARYDALRRRRTRPIWRQSRFTGRIAQASHPMAAGLRDTMLRAIPPSLTGRAARRAQAWTAPSP